MAFSIYRRHAPHWPPLKQSYQQSYQHLGSRESLPLNALPLTPLSSLHSAATVYSPDPLSYPSAPLLTSPTKPAERKKWAWHGWRGGARTALFGAVVVLLVNISLLIAILTSGTNMMGGTWMVYSGSCNEVERQDTWIHLALNVVATLLLANSSYCMQLLSAPNRSEIDRAHAKRKWLDVGIPSVRNLGSLNKKKVVVWWVLGISSIPLHLIYNSVFFSALATNNYSILYATQDFVQGGSYDQQEFPDTEPLNITDVQARASQFERLDNEDCIRAYAKDFIEDRRNVIAIVKNVTGEPSLLHVSEQEFPAHITPQYNPYAWICDSPTVVNQTGACCENEWGFVPCPKIAPELVQMADQWTTGGFEIDHCLSETVTSFCHLHFSVALMSVVIAFNILKVLGMGYVAYALGEAPMVTVGDAIQSFLLRPDRMSEGMCLASHQSVVRQFGRGYTPMPVRYERPQYRWYDAASWRQWVFLLLLFALAAVATIVFLVLGITHLNIGEKRLQSAWNIGLGNVRPQNLIMGLGLPSLGNASIAVSTLIANTPQVLFSFLYVCYNAMFTNFFLAYEWSKFAVQRKYLRVSHAVGQQKSTYFVNLPYRYGLPLLIGSGLLHWLVSQALFLANITIIPRDGMIPMQDEITTVAYSPLAMLLVLCLGIVFLLFLLATACRKLPVGMPLVGSNSLAIAAACHPPLVDQSEREEMVLRPITWGAVPGKVDADEFGAIGHCCFSDRVVEPPETGKLYA